MVNDGKITDKVIENLIPFIMGGDILIDEGNSNYLKTKERYNYLRNKRINFIDIGVYVREECSRHLVKMVHNGIEYA